MLDARILCQEDQKAILNPISILATAEDISLNREGSLVKCLPN